jgi:prepilin-type N-terminal cleavage/methylation domain-containing protein
MQSDVRSRGDAFTLIELLVVIAIIGILLALLLPAVQYSREAARKSTCQNHLRQIGVAMHTHEGVHRHLPTGGWGWRWTGEPDRGFDESQPGGWVYNLLPYVEQNNLRTAGLSEPHPQRAQVLSASASVVLDGFNCPSRRTARALPFVHVVDYVNMVRPKFVARSDYAACSGDVAPDVSQGRGRGPPSFADGDSPTFVWVETDRTGVVFRRSRVTFGEIIDGLTNTYMAGEKYLARERYNQETRKRRSAFARRVRQRYIRVTDAKFPPRQDATALRRPLGRQRMRSAHGGRLPSAIRVLRRRWRIHHTRGNRHGGRRFCDEQ